MIRGAGLRGAVKGWIERGLSRGGLAALGRRRRRGQTLILAYHNILPHGTPAGADRSLHLPQAAFAAQLDDLAATCEVVPLESALSGPAAVGRPRVAITFDDAYRGAVTAGVAELARRGLPATIFVAPGVLNDHAFWWDRFIDAAGNGFGEAERARALEEGRGEDAAVAALASGLGFREVPVPAAARSATQGELRSALGFSGLALGAHSWSHPNLARLGGTALAEECTRPRAWLQQFTQRALPWVAYPYGLSSDEVEGAVAAAGYAGGLLIEGGWSRGPSVPPFRTPRYNVPAGISRDGFRARLAGWLAA